MRKSYKIMTAALVAGLLMTGAGLVNSALASQETEKAAEKVVTEYVTGFNKGDIDKMMKHVKDTRVQDSAALKNKYEKYAKRNKERSTELKFVDLEKIDDENFKAIFEISSNEFKPTQFTLPVITENGEWRILVDGSVVVDTK